MPPLEPSSLPDLLTPEQVASLQGQPGAPEFVPEEKGVDVGGTLKALGEGAAETATLGLSSAFEKGAGVKPEDILSRAKEHPIAHGVGEVAGAVAPALLGDEAGALNILGKVGEAGETAGRALLGGAKKAVPLAQERLAVRLSGWAGRGAAESALLSGEHVLSEHVLGDPRATGEHAVAEIGLAALLGGAGGAILGKAGEAVGDLGRKLTSRDGGLLENLTKLKGNAAEIGDAAERLGVEPLPGQLSASRTVQDLQSQITKEPTILGRKEQAAVDAHYDAIRKATTDALGEAGGMTKAEVNQVLKEGLESAVDETYAPLREGFAALRARNVEFPVDAEELARLQKSLPEIEGAHKRPGSPEGSFTRRVAEQLPLQETVDDLRRLRTSVGAEGFSHTRPELWHYATTIKEGLDALEEKSVNSALIKAVQEGKITQEEARNLVFLNASTKEGYRELRGHIEKLAKVLGKNKINGVEHFFSILDDKAASGQLAQKLFTKESSSFLKFMKERFPEQARVLGQYEKSRIAEKAFKDGVVQPGVALREIGKLEPEARRFLFTDQDLRKLGDAETLLESMPKDINPSGTAKSASWKDALNPARHVGEALLGGLAHGPAGAVAGLAAGIVGPEVSTLLKRSLARGLVSGVPDEIARHAAVVRLMDLSGRTTRSVTKAAKAVLAREAVEHIVPSREEHGKLVDRVMKVAADPQVLMDRLSKATEGMAQHAPETGSAVSATAARAVQFLETKRPKPVQPSPFSAEYKPGAFAESKFRRYAAVVANPVSTLYRVKDGSLAPQDVEALQAVYPSLYSSMRAELLTHLTTAASKGVPVPYKVRLGASLFLGSPLDRSLAPGAVASLQAGFMADAAHSSGGAPAPKKSTSALDDVGQQTATPEQAAAARRLKP